MNPSTKTHFPRWTLPKAGRPSQAARTVDRNQTFDVTSSIGRQPLSRKQSAGVCHFGSSGRANMEKVAFPKDMMQSGVSVKLYHPKF